MFFDMYDNLSTNFKRVPFNPSMAQYILDNSNINNRNLSPSVVKKYADDMRGGYGSNTV